jgi:hypothetical protein
MPDFKFFPLDHVKIVAFGLNYPGRIAQCCWQPDNGIVYDVEYAADGEIKRREFYADELERAV